MTELELKVKKMQYEHDLLEIINHYKCLQKYSDMNKPLALCSSHDYIQFYKGLETAAFYLGLTIYYIDDYIITYYLGMKLIELRNVCNKEEEDNE